MLVTTVIGIRDVLLVAASCARTGIASTAFPANVTLTEKCPVVTKPKIPSPEQYKPAVSLQFNVFHIPLPDFCNKGQEN